jgi:hypothetical protein
MEDHPVESTPTPSDMPPLAAVLQRYAGTDPAHVLLDEDTTASCIEQKRKTLESWRREGRELPFIKIGRSVRYRLSDVLAFLERNTFRSSREARTRDRGIPMPGRQRPRREA